MTVLSNRRMIHREEKQQDIQRDLPEPREAVPYLMSAHTPGPWMTTCRKTGGDWELHDPTGRLVGTAVAMSDARLIAAAPQLLDALIKLTNESAGFLAMADPITHGNTNITVLDERIRLARAAISKAKGAA